MNIQTSSKAKYLAEQAKYKTDEIVSGATTAKNAIDDAKYNISLEKTKGFNLTNEEVILSQAEQAFETRNYNEAKSLANKAKSEVEKIVREAGPAKNAIDNAKSDVYKEKAQGYGIEDAESMLLEAEQLFINGNYSQSKILAEQARTNALDIDSDGVPNDSDLAPSINNYYIYSGVAIFLVGLVSTYRMGSKSWEKLKHECQHLAEKRQRQEEDEKSQESARREAQRLDQERRESERRRVEEEKHRREEKERRRKEKMKQDILKKAPIGAI